MSPASIEQYIDKRFPVEKSIILRYHTVLTDGSLTLDDLRETSINEGVRFFKLCTYQGVDIFILDETTLMPTGTCKSIDGCVAISHARKRGLKKIAFSSGANTGMALTLYAQNFDIETFFFHPETTLFKMNARWLGNPRAHLITVDRPEKEVKRAVKIFSGLLNITNGLEDSLRFLGARSRALAIAEEMLKNNIRFSYIAQTVCAGFGPIGIYRMLARLAEEGILTKEKIPQFLGIQQESISAMVRAWKEKRDYLIQANAEDKELPIEPALYNRFPSETYPEMYRLLKEFGGELISVAREDYRRYADLFISYLEKTGLKLTKVRVGNKMELIEKAGVIAGAGVLKSIESGLIKKRARVLCCLTGGVIGDFKPLPSVQYEIKKDGLLEGEVERYIDNYGICLAQS